MEARTDNTITAPIVGHESITTFISSFKEVKPDPGRQIFQEDAAEYVENIKNAPDIGYVFSSLYRLLYIEKRYPNISVFSSIIKKCIEFNCFQYAIDIYSIAKKSKIIDVGMHTNIMVAATMLHDFNLLQVAYADALLLQKKQNLDMPSLYHTMLNCLMKFKDLYQMSSDPDQLAEVKRIIDQACLIYEKSGLKPQIIMKDGKYRMIDFHGFNRGSTYFALYYFLLKEQEKIKLSKDKNMKLAIVELTIGHGLGHGSIEEDHMGRHPVQSGVYAFLEDIELNKIYDIKVDPSVDNPGLVLTTIKEKKFIPQKKNNQYYAKQTNFPTFFNQGTYSPEWLHSQSLPPQPIYDQYPYQGEGQYPYQGHQYQDPYQPQYPYQGQYQDPYQRPYPYQDQGQYQVSNQGPYQNPYYALPSAQNHPRQQQDQSADLNSYAPPFTPTQW